MRQKPIEAGTNVGRVSEHNRRVVLKALRLNGPLSRAEISRGTGLVPQTVSNIMLELETEGLVVPSEIVRGRRGQPAIPYQIAPNGAFALGLQIDQYGARGAAINQIGEVVATTEVVFSGSRLESNLTAMVCGVTALRKELEGLAAQGIPRIAGLGVAMPAPTGVHLTPSDPWMLAARVGNPIVDALATATGLSVSLHHDGAAAAVAERLNGAAKGTGNFVLIFVGYGLGAGIHVHGSLYDGHHHLAGELGQIPTLTPQGFIPLEEAASLAPLFARLKLSPHDGFSFQRIEAAIGKDTYAVADWLNTAAPQLAWLVETLNCILDPECVVLSGQMPERLLSDLFSSVAAFSRDLFPHRGTERPRLVLGSSDVFSVAAGAAAYPLARTFDPSLAAISKIGRNPATAAISASVENEAAAWSIKRP